MFNGIHVSANGYNAHRTSFPEEPDDVFRSSLGIDYIESLDYSAGLVGSSERPRKEEVDTRIFDVSGHHPFPKEVLDIRKALGGDDKTMSNMGLISTLQQVYFIVENRIVWWDLKTSKFTYYEGVHGPIIDIAFVKSQAGSIADVPANMLVVYTEDEMLLLTLSFDANSLLQIYPTTYVLPLFGKTITKIASSSSGRVFVGSADGYVYELVYQGVGGWLGSDRFRLVNLTTSVLGSSLYNLLPAALKGTTYAIVDLMVDERRELLYAVNDRNDVEAWSFTNEPTSNIRSIGIVTGRHIEEKCIDTEDPVRDFMIVSLCPTHVVSAHLGSANADVIAITNNGRRVMITATAERETKSTNAYTSAYTARQTPEHSHTYIHTLPAHVSSNTHPPHPQPEPHPQAHKHMDLNSSSVIPNPFSSIGAGRYTQLQSPENAQHVYIPSVMYEIRFKKLKLLPVDAKAPTPEILRVSHAYASSGAFLVNTRGNQQADERVHQYNPYTDGRDYATSNIPPGAVLCVGYEYLTTAYPQQHYAEVYTYLIDESVQVVDIQEIECTQLNRYPHISGPPYSLELFSQYFFPRRAFHVLTTNGLYTIEKIRPIDSLKEIMSNADMAKEYKVGTSNDESMLLSLLCDGSLNQETLKRVGDTFFSVAPSCGALVNRQSDHRATSFGSSVQTYWNLPLHIQGLALYLRRIIQPIKDICLFHVLPESSQNGLVRRTLGKEEMKMFLSKLCNLREFMCTRPWICTTEMYDETKNLEAVLNGCIQCLHLSDILFRNINRTSATTHKNDQYKEHLAEIHGLTINSILTNKDIHARVHTLTRIIAYDCLLDASTTNKNAMRVALLNNCPDFFSSSDSITLEVKLDLQNLLNLPISEYNHAERLRKHAIGIIEKFIASEGVDIAELTHLCDMLDQLRVLHNCDLTTEIVETCLRMAFRLRIKSDEDIETEMALRQPEPAPIVGKRRIGRISGGESEGPASVKWHNPPPKDTQENMDKRMSCYGLVFKYIIYNDGDDIPEPKPGPLHAAIRSDNHEFLSLLYAKFVESPRLHSFLVRLAPKEPGLLNDFLYSVHSQTMREIYMKSLRPEEVKGMLQRAELICERESMGYNPHKAAEIMNTMACAEGDIHIRTRIELFRKALSFAKATRIISKKRGGTDFQDFLAELDGRIKLAELQLAMYEELDGMIQHHPLTNDRIFNKLSLAKRDLQFELVDVTELYKYYAEALGMHGMCLRLMNIADYKGGKVYEIWARIVHEAEDYQSFLRTMNEMGTLFGDSEYFPWVKIIEMVHKRWNETRYESERGSGHLYQSLHDCAGLRFIDLLRAYHGLETSGMIDFAEREHVREIVLAIVDSILTLTSIELELTHDDCQWLTPVVISIKGQVPVESLQEDKLNKLLNRVHEVVNETWSSRST
eukprot:CFRG4406T1